MKAVEITRSMVGICHMQVCVAKEATDDEILAVCNESNPSGTGMGWSFVCRGSEDSFLGTSMAPCACAQRPDRLHLIVGC